MLSKKYYKEFAEMIRLSNNKDELVSKLIDFFIVDNPRFSIEKFKEAIQ